MYKPDTYTSLAPYLIIEDARLQLAFIKAVFDVDPLFTVPGEGGGIGHAEVRIDDTILMMGEAPGEAGAHLHLYVADVDAVFERARSAGGIVVQEPMEKGDGDRRGGIKDPAGTTWWLSTQMKPRD